MRRLEHFITGAWTPAEGAGSALHDAFTGDEVFETGSTPPMAPAVDYARQTGGPALRAMTPHARALMLKAIGQQLMERKEELYTLSAHTGATRSDSWIDIDGGIGTLLTYASRARRELPNSNVMKDGPPEILSKDGTFIGQHIRVPREGALVMINAYNFPVWGMLEKFAANFLAGMPCIVKPATATSYVTEACVRLMQDSGALPEGALQLVIGGTGDLLDQLDEQDVITFTGSADTARKLRAHPNVINRSIPFNAEADSLNSAILAPDVTPDDEEFDLLAKEIVREMTVKAGQKCTAIRRIMVPQQHLDAFGERLIQRLEKITLGDPDEEGVRMGALASIAQKEDVTAAVNDLLNTSECLFGADGGAAPIGKGTENGAFFAPRLLRSTDPHADGGAHDIEAFGPVSTLMGYGDLDEAVALAAKGKGSLVTTFATKDPKNAARAIPALAARHGRLQVLNAEAAKESTGHGAPLPMLKHGGPGRAGGGEELGGIRAVHHYLQRTAIQGSPTMLAAVTGEYVRGAEVLETEVHPFRRHFDDLAIGESLLTHRRTVTEADIVNFGCLSGDHFYMHFDEIAAKDSQFGKRIAHGYFVLSAAAGLFVSPGEGPVLANYGLDTLRFIEPVAPGDTIRARLTCKRKIDQGRTSPDGHPQGVVVWDVQVTNQNDELVASYDILTLVAKKPE